MIPAGPDGPKNNAASWVGCFCALPTFWATASPSCSSINPRLSFNVKRRNRGKQTAQSFRTRKYHGHHGCQPAADQAQHPDDDLHAGAGTVQCGGLDLCRPCQRERPDRRLSGLFAAEPDVRRGHRHRRGCQRPALQEPGRKEPVPRQQDRRERPVPGAVQLPGLSGAGPDRCAPLLLRPDRRCRHRRAGHPLPDHLLRAQPGHVHAGDEREAAGRYQPHHPEHDQPAGGCHRQHHP